MTVCEYFIRGNCRFGDKCRNEHPSNAPKTGNFGNKTWTAPDKAAVAFTVESMTKDLSPHVDKPLWPLSSYGPAKHEPALISGLEESPEELRFKAFQAQKTGNMAEYLAYEASAISKADQVMSNAKSNVSQAYEQAMRKSAGPDSGFPSNASKMSAFTSAPQAFGTPSAQPSVFGSTSTAQPSAFSNSSNQASAFGTTSTAQPSVFGSSSAFTKPALGQTSFAGQAAQTTPAMSTLGQPTAFGSNTTASAFGQPSFGQPSSFGQSAPSLIKPATGAFGGGGAFSAFAGQPSAFGLGAANNSTGTTSVFGQSVFGTSSKSVESTPAPAQTGGSVFGQSSLGSNATTPAFGTPSTFGAMQQPKQPTFGQSAFSQITASGQSAFGSSTFGSSNIHSAFGSTATQSPSTFGMATQSSPMPVPSVFGAPASTSVFGQSAFGRGSAFSQPAPAQTPPEPKAVSGPPDFVNAKSTYKSGLNAYDAKLPPNYMDILPAAVKNAFSARAFEWGNIPAEWVPPLEMR